MRFLLFSWLSFLSLIDLSWGYGQCLENQTLLLLQLKQNLCFPASASATLTSWDSNTDCCSSWDGIECDGNGHVTAVDLNNKSISCIGNWSSLFGLTYLQSLNLSYNRFISTPIPSGLDMLANLTHLNLSNSGFAGQIPIGISHMKRLVSLDLSTLFAFRDPLKLVNPDLRTLVRDLVELRELYLDGVNISMPGKEWGEAVSSALPNLRILSLSDCYLSGPLDSSLLKLQSLSKLRLDQNIISAQVPDFFGKFSNMSYLHLSACGLLGELPEKIFQLPVLKILDLSINPRLQGYVPESPLNGSLESLLLSDTNFSRILPESIGNLRFLSKLKLSNCGFSGSIPTSMSNLAQLEIIDLSSNSFTGPIPNFGLSKNLIQINLSHNRLKGTIASNDWGRLLKLVSLNLRNNSLNGTIPSSLCTLPLLQRLELSQNRFSGHLSDFSNVTLSTLDFSHNFLQGEIPSSIFNVTSLEIFILSSNNLSGTIELKRFQSFRNLSSLDLSDNNMSIISSGTDSALFPQVATLKLSSCNLKTFPEFLSNQTTLSYLDLSNNQISGKIPNWIGRIGNGSLLHLNLSSNLLRDPDQPLPGGSFSSLAIVDLHSNLLQGPIPILPRSASFLDYSKNNITSIIPLDIGSSLRIAIFFSLSSNFVSGEIPSSICQAEYLQVLDLSNNSLSGSIPTCLSRNSTLRVLNLRSNHFSGTIPERFKGACSLRTLDLNGNKFEGDVPKTLSNCIMLEVLDLGNNQINGLFPCWLGELSHLRVLVLRSNKFSGSIPYPETNTTFEMLQIIDLSSNHFTGKLPSARFLRWKGMMTEEESVSRYKHSIIKFGFLELSRLYYQDAITVTSKGQQMELVKILTIFTSIDLSHNNFEGEIPEVIGNLTALYILNLSRNALTGPIPSSLGSLKQLESLDLSDNKLSGMIPSELEDLTFLSVLNVSSNQLVGTIPQDRQFQTFSSNAFEGNKGLCGPPLLEKCRNDSKLVPSPEKSSKSAVNFDWEFIVTGLGFGGGAALVIAPLWLWAEGRKWYDQQIERLLLIIFPSIALLHNICDDGTVDTNTMREESFDEEFTENNDEGKGRYCVFCTKIDISFKRPVHNPKCNCHA